MDAGRDSWRRGSRMHRPAPARVGLRSSLLVAGLIVGGMCALLALNTAAAAEELRRHALSQANADMADDVQQLQARLAAREAPAALARAPRELGMVPAGNPAFLSIQPDGRVKVLGDPQPATAPPPTPKPTQARTHRAVKKPPKTTSIRTKPPVGRTQADLDRPQPRASTSAATGRTR